MTHFNLIFEREHKIGTESYYRITDVFFHKLLLIPLTTAIFYLLILEISSYFFKKSRIFSNQEGPAKRVSMRYFTAVGGLYLSITALFFYPTFPFLNNCLIGPPSDNMLQFWNIWWINKVLTKPGLHFLFTNCIFYPEGGSLLYHPFSFYNLVLAAAMRPFLSPVLIYNLLILHTFVLAGIGAFMLIHYLTKNSLAAVIGGFVFAFNPSHFAHSLYHLEISSIQFLPFFVLFFIKTVRGNSKKDLFLCAFFFFLNALCSWYYFVFSVSFIILAYAYLAVKRKRVILNDVLFKSLVTVGATSLILMPWLFRMFIYGFRFFEEVQFLGHNTYVADMVALFVPDRYHWLGRVKIIEAINALFTGNDTEKTVYLGIINIFIVSLAFKNIFRWATKYFLGFLVFLVFSMGAFLHIFGWISPILLPYGLIRLIPGFSFARAPSRLIVYVYLFWAIIVAFALKAMLETGKSNIRKKFFSAAVIICIFLDYCRVDNLKTRVYLPPCYYQLKKSPDSFGILDLPGGFDENCRYVMYQTLHGIPIVQGFIARKLTPSLIDYLELGNLAKQKDQLMRNNVKYIIIHKKLISSARPVDIDRYKKTYRLEYEDAHNIVFQVY